MISPPLVDNEVERLRALVELQLLDTPPEATFDHCVELAAAVCGTAKAAVSLVDRERQWFKAIFGDLPAETRRDVAFCGHVVAHDDVLIVPDASMDPRFATNPLVQAGLRFYAGVPLHGRDGSPIGTLCVLNDQPLAMTQAQLARLREVADALQTHLDLRLLALKLGARLEARSEEALRLKATQRRKDADTLSAVHDLKNPLAVVAAGAAYLAELDQLPAAAKEAIQDILASTEVASRLLVDLIDTSRLEGGQLKRQFTSVDLRQVAARVVRQARLLAGERDQALRVEDAATSATVAGDHLLLERTLRNLVDNALKYAPRGRPVTVVLRDGPGDSVELRVEDEGSPIPAERRADVFEPYVRLAGDAGPTGHGLGLAFCRNAVALHGGALSVESRDGGGNAFVLRLPRRQPSPEAGRPAARAG